MIEKLIDKILLMFLMNVYFPYEHFIRKRSKNEYIGLLAFDEINKDRLNEMLRNFMEKFRRSIIHLLP